MGRVESTNDEETETETVDGEITESEESAANKKTQLFGLPFYKLSYKRLPKKCLNASFVVINGATFLVGISTVAILIWMLADSKLMLRLTGQRLFVTILLMIGIFGVTVSFLGIYAFVKRRRDLMNPYIFFHAIFLCTIFFCSILSTSFFDRITNMIHENMNNTIIKYGSLDWVTEAWDNTQQDLKCCGTKSYKDWAVYDMLIPRSCCSKSIEHCLKMDEGIAFDSGCLKSAYFMLRSYIDSVAAATIFISIVSGASLFFALGIKKRLKVCRYVED